MEKGNNSLPYICHVVGICAAFWHRSSSSSAAEITPQPYALSSIEKAVEIGLETMWLSRRKGRSLLWG